jgi:hypothetical protein
MRSRRALLVLFAIVVAVIPVLAVPESTPDDLERNRRLLDAWRADPEHYARLRRDLKAFWELPEDQRERLRRLDHDLHETDARTQKRLAAVLERYGAWLDRLPEIDRQAVTSSDRTERIKAIRAIRDRQYLEALPRKIREEYAQLPPVERRSQLDRLRREDRQLRRACKVTSLARPEAAPKAPAGLPTPVAKPIRRQDFPADVRYYVDNVLWRQISAAEADKLQAAEGAPWPALARVIWELSEKYPVKLPGPVLGPRRFIELPAEVTKALPIKDFAQAQRRRLNELNGKWPEFAMEYSAYARKIGMTLPRQLGPCHANEFDAAVAQFIDRALLPKLAPKEKDELKAAEGHWPEYPKLLLELSKKHNLEVPLMRLPGPTGFWDQVRPNA